MAAEEHKYVRIERGDLVIISARVIPGNERTIGRVVNALYRLGAEVLYEDNAFVHVSGHASQEDLKMMFNLTRPRYFIPVHGEYRHLLGHARLAQSVGIGPERVFLIEDGMGVEVSKTEARLVGPFPAGRVLVDGKSVGDIGAVVLRDRQLLAEDGLIAVSLAVGRDGTVLAGPEIASRGFVYVKENEPLLEELKKAVLAALAERDPDVPYDREITGATVRLAVRQFVNQRFRRRAAHTGHARAERRGRRRPRRLRDHRCAPCGIRRRRHLAHAGRRDPDRRLVRDPRVLRGRGAHHDVATDEAEAAQSPVGAGRAGGGGAAAGRRAAGGGGLGAAGGRRALAPARAAGGAGARVAGDVRLRPRWRRDLPAATGRAPQGAPRVRAQAHTRGAPGQCRDHPPEAPGFRGRGPDRPGEPGPGHHVVRVRAGDRRQG